MAPEFAALILAGIVVLAVVMLEVATRSFSNLIAAVKHRHRLHKRGVR